MTMPLHHDWVPGHCLDCLTYMGHDDAAFASCPDECTHRFDHKNKSGGQCVCPTCHNNWQAIPPDEWEGSMLTRPEKPIAPPPPEYADRLDESLLYSGRAWTREAVYG